MKERGRKREREREREKERETNNIKCDKKSGQKSMISRDLQIANPKISNRCKLIITIRKF